MSDREIPDVVIPAGSSFILTYLEGVKRTKVLCTYLVYSLAQHLVPFVVVHLYRAEKS